MDTREAMAGIARAVEITAIGCPFFNRCPLAIDGTCDREPAPVREDRPGHAIACHRTLEELRQSEQRGQEVLHGYEAAKADEEERKLRR